MCGVRRQALARRRFGERCSTPKAPSPVAKGSLCRRTPTLSLPLRFRKFQRTRHSKLRLQSLERTSTRLQISGPIVEWWRRRGKCRFQLRALSPVATHGLMCPSVDCDESLIVNLGRRAITMVGKNTDQIKIAGLGYTPWDLGSITVENPRWQMGELPVACEKVGTEQQLEVLAVESGVACRMPRKVYDLQSVPNIQPISVVEQSRWSELSKPKERSA